MNLNSLFKESIRARSQLFNYQSVRWRRPRKPFWLGVAKSKMFVIPTPKIVHTPEEKKVYQFLENNYNSAFKSLMNFITNDNPRIKDMVTETGSTNEIKRSAAVEKRIEESLKKNELWNSESARLREERTKREKELKMENVIKEIDILEKKKTERLNTIEEIVRKEKNLSQSFITPENLDEAIEKCLDKIDCFDFAIDLDGNKYHGRESLPSNPNSTKNEEQMIKEFFS